MERARVRGVLRSALPAVTVMAFAAAAPGCGKRGENAGPAPEASGTAAIIAASASASSEAAGGAASAKPGAAKGPAEGGKGDAALTAEERARYQKFLNEGRSLHEKKDYAGAVKAFEQALAIAPDDPRALSELGWAAFFAKDLDRAEESTKKAIERATEPYLKASSYYNLGRIREERGDREGAISSYRISLGHRFNPTVKARLAKLDPAAGAALEILGVRPIKGPVVSLEAFCEDVKKRALPQPVRCDAGAKDLGEAYRGPSSVPKPAPPYLTVRVIASAMGAGDGGEAPAIGGGETSYHLAIRTKVGWFVMEDAASTYNPGAFGITESVEVKELWLRDALPGGAPELFFRSVHYRGDSNLGVNELEEYVDETLLVCGIGPSERPSCTRPIPVSWSEHIGLISPDMDEPGVKHALKDVKGSLSAAFSPADGQLEITGDVKTVPEAWRGLIGKHTIRFP
jgi:tetratricopeptide (TPR) repeat protein